MTTLTLESSELTNRLSQLAREQQTTPEILLKQVVQDYVGRNSTRQHVNGDAAFRAEFEREVANFEMLKPRLLEQYMGRVVAVYQGKVIEIGDDILDVYDAVVKKHGTIPCYVQSVSVESPRKVRVPTIWKSR